MAADFVTRGRSFVEQGQLQEAVRVCRLGLLANPGEIEGRLVLGSALIGLARFDEVLAEMHSALAMEPNNPSALALKGEALLRKGDARQADSVLEKAALSAPADPYVERLRAEARAQVSNNPMTMEIDPELEGVELRDDDSLNDDVYEGSVEELDQGLLTEITPTPIPLNEQEAIASHAMALLDESGDQPFEDHYRGHYEMGPSVDAPRRLDVPFPGDLASEQVPALGSPPPAMQRPPTIGTLFPDEESGVSRVELIEVAGVSSSEPESDPSVKLPVPRGMTSDMDLIREGIGHGARKPTGPRPVSTAKDAPAEPRALPEGRAPRQLPFAVWGALAILVSAGGAVGGVKIRDARMSRQVRAVNAKARELASDDTYLAHRKARDLYGRVAKARKSDRAWARLARQEAVLAAEFAESPEAAKAHLGRVDDETRVDVLAARGYLALAKGDAEATASAAQSILSKDADDAVGHYLRGRARLLVNDGEEAATALQKAIGISATPLTFVALAEAEAVRGRYPEALAALGRATEEVDEHPAAVLALARILIDSNDLPKNPDDPDARIQALLKRAESEPLSMSRAQVASAQLILAELSWARDDAETTSKRLDDLLAAVGADAVFAGRRYMSRLAELLLATGRTEVALQAANAAAKRWPDETSSQLVLADLRLRDGKPQEALELVAAINKTQASARGLRVAGQAHLQLRELDKAKEALDGALELAPDDVEAKVARASVDTQQGRPEEALERLEDIFEDAEPADVDPSIQIAYAAALREVGKGEQAQEILERLLKRLSKDSPGEKGELPQASGAVLATIELAQLAEQRGAFKEADTLYNRALKGAASGSHELLARRGLARLALAAGKASEAREILEDLFELHDDDGDLLLELARVRTLFGDVDGALTLIDSASTHAPWLAAEVARERGRIHMRRGAIDEAVSELSRAQSLRPSDVEARLLLAETLFEGRRRQGLIRTSKQITEKFSGSVAASLAGGMLLLLDNKAPEATKSFQRAKEIAERSGASDRVRADCAYWLGRSLEVSGNLLDASKWLDTATKLDATHASAYYWLGQIAHQNQALPLMVKNYQRALEIDPGLNPLAWYFLATHFAAEGDKEQAIRSLESFLANAPSEAGDIVDEAKSLLKKLKG